MCLYFSVYSISLRKFREFKGWPWMQRISTFFHWFFSKTKIEIKCLKNLRGFDFSTMISEKHIEFQSFFKNNKRGKKLKFLKFKASPNERF